MKPRNSVLVLERDLVALDFRDIGLLDIVMLCLHSVGCHGMWLAVSLDWAVS